MTHSLTTHSLIGADRRTHIKIVALACFGLLAVVLVGATARDTTAGAPGMQAAVVKIGKPAAVAVHGARTIR